MEPPAMQNYIRFRGFFSYAHYDAETDPGLVEAFATALEKRVNAKLANARFEIWRDTQGLRTGDKWHKTLEEELRGSDILIVLFTPRWIESDFCRNEYSIFEEIEARRSVGEYILPILARSIDKQEKHFTPNQKDICGRLRERQYKHALVSEFLSLNKPKRVKLIDELADDIEGMIERLRLLPKTAESAIRPGDRGHSIKEFDAGAHNFEQVDFVKTVEVVLDPRVDNNERGIYAQIDFFERLYVQGKRGRIDFGVRRAFLSIGKDGPEQLVKVADLKGGIDKDNVYYVTLHDSPNEVSICIDPQPGKLTLSDLAFPPAENENYLSKVAMVGSDTKIDQLKAELILSLNAEGLHLAEEKGNPLKPRVQEKIKAIMDIAAAKVAVANNQSTFSNGLLRRKLRVQER
jgi:hypothetical protein